MAFFNKFLKRRKTGEKLETPKESHDSHVEKKAESTNVSSIRFGVAPRVERAHITEKTAIAGERGVYTFIVAEDANKHEIKRAVEAKYGAKVRKVHMISIPGKIRRRGRQIGWKAGLKKAIVTLADGARLDVQ